jgi:spore coat protein CotH
MKNEEFEKITKLVETKNELFRKITNLEFYKTEDSFVFSNISNALYDEKMGRSPESAFASVCVKHKKELYGFIIKLCDEEETAISKQIDDIDKKLENIKIIF